MLRVAYTRIGMQIQKHVNPKAGGSWYRCERVVFEQGLVKWELSRTGRYELLKAYAQKPHRQLIEAGDDNALRAFVKTWGPLDKLFLPKAWEGTDTITSYRRERDTLQAWVRFLAAIESPRYLHDAILGLLRLFDKGEFIWFRGRLGISGRLKDGFSNDIERRLGNATQNEIADVCDHLAGIFPLHVFPRFVIDRTGKGSIVAASSGVNSLTTALYWMVWQDIFMENPWQFCEECHKEFQPDFHHERKFCFPECAHRKAARESARRKREKERNKNVTRKTG
jgi:hypothetical protein